MPTLQRETTINFNTTNWLGTSGFANTAPGTFGTGAAACYSQNGMVVGIVEDKSEFGDDSHIHKENGTTPPDRFVKFEADSSGIQIRALDSTVLDTKPFKLTSLVFRAPITAANPIYGAYATVDEFGFIQPDGTNVKGPDEYWEILGYASAINPGLDMEADSDPVIARTIVPNGFSVTVADDITKGDLLLDSAFNNIGAFWIHYQGYQHYPENGISFLMELDNVKVNAAVAAVSVPAAVWMFLRDIMGLLALGKKKSNLTA